MTRIRKRYVVLAILAIIAAVLTVIDHREDDPLTRYGFFHVYDSPAGKPFRLLGAPPGSGPLTNFRHRNSDNSPFTASGSYVTPGSARDALRYYVAGCRRLGLSTPASNETTRNYPGAICDGEAIVVVTPRCDDDGCTTGLGVMGW